MKSLLFYLLQVVVVSGILYAYYHIALRNKKFHQYNRFYILAATLASILIPFLNIPVYFSTEDASAQWLHALQTFSADEAVIVIDGSAEQAEPFNWQALLYTVYGLIALAGAVKICLSIRKLRKIMQEHPVEQLNGIRFINTAVPGTPFSFFRWLFWNNRIELSSQKGEQIFRHEIFHIEQKHSLDTVFMEIVTIVFWINPLFHLMKKELKAIHEFLADRFATNETQKWEYAEMLLMQALNTRHSLVHPFFHNQIKRRIAMITNPNKTSHQYLRKLLVLPLGAMVITLFAFSYKQKQTDQLEETLLYELNPVVQDTSGPKLQVQEIRPDNVITLQTSHIRFNTTETKTSRGTSEVLEVRPVHFDTVPDKQPVRIRLNATSLETEKKPLIILDGVIKEQQDFQKTLYDLDPNQIESISILKDSSAESLYGPKGKNGVLLITTKASSVTGKLQPVSPELKEVTVTGVPSRKAESLRSRKNDLEEITVVGYATRKTDSSRVAGRIVPDEEVRIVQGYPVNRTDAIFTAAEVEPAFPGGAPAWYNFLTKNLDAGIPTQKGAPGGTYTIYIKMLVNEKGELSNFKALTNHGFGMEQAAIAALENSPNWIPAHQGGHTVKAYKIQPFTFSVNGEKKSLKLSKVENTDLSAFVYPNPAKNNITVRFNSKETNDVTVRILDMSGKEHSRSSMKLNKGSNNTTISTADLAPGTYILRAEGSGNLSSSVKFVKE